MVIHAYSAWVACSRSIATVDSFLLTLVSAALQLRQLIVNPFLTPFQMLRGDLARLSSIDTCRPKTSNSTSRRVIVYGS